jgi:hypothetical protein
VQLTRCEALVFTHYCGELWVFGEFWKVGEVFLKEREGVGKKIKKIFVTILPWLP